MSQAKPPKAKKKFSIFPWDWDFDDTKEEPKPSTSSSKQSSKPPKQRTKEVQSPPKPAPRSRKEIIYDTSIHKEKNSTKLVELPRRESPAPSVPPSPSSSLRQSRVPVQPRVPIVKPQSSPSFARIPQKPPSIPDSFANSVLNGPPASSGQVAAPRRPVPPYSKPRPSEYNIQGGQSLGPRSFGDRNRFALAAFDDGDFETDPMVDSSDLTFEKSVLALIRLRRLHSRLLRNRERYVKEMGLFRGWDDERYLYILEQIAKTNHQMDELDPLIASLEAFIKEDHNKYISADPVSKYSSPGFRTNGVPETSNRYGNSIGKQNFAGEKGSRIEPASATQAINDELENEIEELRKQVRNLEMEKRGGFNIVTNGYPTQEVGLPTAAQQVDRIVGRREQNGLEKPAERRGRSSEQSSEDVSIELNSSIDRYEDFKNCREALSNDLRDDFSKLDDLMREFETSRQTSPLGTSSKPPSERRDSNQSTELKPKYSPAPNRRLTAGQMIRLETNGSRKGSLMSDDEIQYDFNLRLDSPEKIHIPERYLDENEIEQETEHQKVLRRAKAEAIRRRLAQPETGVSEKEQQEREKVLLMTPILARQVKERSRAVAMQAQSRNQR